MLDSSTSSNPNQNGWGMHITDYFTPSNVNALDDADEDFGSGAPLVLPDSAGIPGYPHLLVAAGKDGRIFLINRDNMGKFNATGDNVLNSVYNSNTGVYTAPTLINGSLSTPAYYHGVLYWVSGYSNDAKAFIIAPITNPSEPYDVAAIAPISETANGNFGYVPGSVEVSANGDEDPQDAVVWIMDNNNGELHAYSALSLSTELWNSGAGSIATVKFSTPDIANGEVFVGTQNGLQVFGLTGPGSPAQAPNTVSNLSAEALSGSSVELDWTDSTQSPNFATNYAIQESADNVNFTTVANAGQESTTYTVTGLSPSTTYYFRIVSSNSAGSSSPSSSVMVTTTNQTGQTPTAPIGLGAVPASGSEVYLNWTNTANNETGFTLTRATDSLFTQNVVVQNIAAAPFYYTDFAAGLSPGNTYYYKIQASNSSGLSSSSNTASASIPQVPPAPTDASAVQNGNTIEVSWTDNAGPFALGYQISRSVDGGPYVIYADRPETSDAPPTTQTFTDTNVPVGHTYSYEIVAENVSGFSAPAYATASILGSANLTLDNAGNLALTVAPGAPDLLSIQLSGGVYTLTDTAVSITVGGAAAGDVTQNGASSVTIPAADVSNMTLDTGDDTDTIDIISDAVPITITADSGGGHPTINLGDPTNNEIISGTITNASNGAMSISGSGTTTINGNLVCQDSGGVTLTGNGTINIAGNINLGATANLTDSAAGADTISGVISGTASSGTGLGQGLIGTYFNINNQPGTGDDGNQMIQPAAASNPLWLGNQTPEATATLVGPIDFQDIADNGFADSVGNPAYFNAGAGNNNVEARWYGDITIPNNGIAGNPISFGLSSDDGSMLYIDGNAVVSDNNYQGAPGYPSLQATDTVDLTPGVHTIDIEYYNGGGAAAIWAQWDPTGGDNSVDIPNSAFSSEQPVNGLTVNGTGTLTLSHTNSYVGKTTIDGGSLIVTANGAMGSATDPGITVDSGGDVAFAGGVDYATAEPITIGGSGPVGNGAIENISGTNAFAAPITLQGNATVGSDAGSLTLGGNVYMGAAGNLTAAGAGQTTITGVISGTSVSGTAPGLIGTYFNINNTNSNDGPSMIQPAQISNFLWLGNQTPAATVLLTGPIDFPNIAGAGFEDNVGGPTYYSVPGGNNQVEARWYGDIMIPGTGTTAVPINFSTSSDDGSMIYVDGVAVVSNNTYQGITQRTGLCDLTPGLHAIDIEYYNGTGGAAMDAQWDPTGGSNFVDIPNAAFVAPGVNGLHKLGSGTLTLSNTNTYVGATTINAGTVVVATDGNLGADPSSATPGNIVLNGGTLLTSASFTLNSSRGIALGDPVTPSTGGEIDVAAGATLTYAGVIANNTGGSDGLTVSSGTDTGTLVLSNTETYTGPTAVNAGTLQLTGHLSVQSTVTVAAGAAIDGTGTYAGSVNVDGTIEAGTPATTGILTTGNLTFGSGTLDAQLNGTTAGSGDDQVNANGVNLTGATLVAALGTGFNPAVGTSFKIISNTSNNPVTSTFVGQPEGSVIMIGGLPFTISYVGGDGNDVVLTCVASTTTTLTSNPVGPITLGTSITFTATIANANPGTWARCPSITTTASPASSRSAARSTSAAGRPRPRRPRRCPPAPTPSPPSTAAAPASPAARARW